MKAKVILKNHSIKENSLNNLNLTEITEVKKVESIDNFDNDNFERDFEKGKNFKNYYPYDNLSNIIKAHKNFRKRTIITLKKIKSQSPIFHKKWIRNTKLNKITPCDEEKHIPLIRQTSITRKNSVKSSYNKKIDQKLVTKQKFSFYDIVNEVLYNQELRKKLQTIKQKLFIEKKNKKKLFI